MTLKANLKLTTLARVSWPDIGIGHSSRKAPTEHTRLIGPLVHQSLTHVLTHQIWVHGGTLKYSPTHGLEQAPGEAQWSRVPNTRRRGKRRSLSPHAHHVARREATTSSCRRASKTSMVSRPCRSCARATPRPLKPNDAIFMGVSLRIKFKLIIIGYRL